MLSSQTKDLVTTETMKKLRAWGLYIDHVLEADDATFNSLIRETRWHQKKVEYIKQTSQILKDKYDYDIPPTVDGLKQLPGVGTKMAMLAMLCCWKKCAGISVDVHVHRISNRLKWAHTKTPEATRIELEGWLPKEYWPRINQMLVGFGQMMCLPVHPRCSQCPVKDLCPSAEMSKREKELRKKYC
eukprot:TRINITY_DN2374_c0_g2_i2.p1 TRINITY_DN2374_c0_g2~~TRINITY_DN2374_c0_g2_i2.p1  ORF type:complete len:186 (+),score=36.09 TRINITY_DN2374_c0_g2_i2:731-1288(+)